MNDVLGGHDGRVLDLPVVFSVGEAHEARVSRRRRERVGKTRLLRGYYSTQESLSEVHRVGSLLTIAGPEAVLCGASSLRLAGVDLPSRLVRDPRTWILVPQHQTWPHRPEVRLVRTSKNVALTQIRGVTSLSLPHCWIQLAGEASLDEMVQIADAMICRQRPVTTKEDIGEAIASSPGTRGVRKAHKAFQLCMPGTDSVPETDVRLLLVRAGLPTPMVNLRIEDTSRRWYFLDLAYAEHKVAVEYDGAIHANRTHVQRDVTRRRVIEDLGWRIITVTSEDLLNDPVGIVNSVRKALKLRT